MFTIYTVRDTYTATARYEDWMLEELLDAHGWLIHVDNMGRVTYAYKFADNLSFTCDMFEVIDELCVKAFEKLIDQHKLNIISVDTKAAPYIFDVVLGYEPIKGALPTDILRALNITS